MNDNDSVRGRGRIKPDQLRGIALVEEKTTDKILDSFFEVYNALGFGFLELPYCDALTIEFLQRGLLVSRQHPAPLFYKGIHLRTYRLDMLVNNKVIVEVKAGEVLPKGALRQLSNYLRATEFEVGLLLHFGMEPKFYRRVTRKNS